MKKIHSSSIVEEGVELGVDVEIGPFCHVRAGAKIGDGTRLHSHVCIWGESVIGNENEIYPYCSIGGPPQIPNDLALKARVVIGNKNTFREAVEIHRGSSRDKGVTQIGNENYIMSSVHIAHDCTVGNKIVIASKTGFAGHVTVEDFAIVSGACGVAQHVRIGSYTYSAGLTRYLKDLPPYLCAKEFAEVTGPNLIGLKRAGFCESDLRIVKEIYKALYLNKGILKDQMDGLRTNFGGNPVFDRFDTFVMNSKIGIMRT